MLLIQHIQYLFVQPGASGLTLSVDWAERVRDASRSISSAAAPIFKKKKRPSAIVLASTKYIGSSTKEAESMQFLLTLLRCSITACTLKFCIGTAEIRCLKVKTYRRTRSTQLLAKKKKEKKLGNAAYESE